MRTRPAQDAKVMRQVKECVGVTVIYMLFLQPADPGLVNMLWSSKVDSVVVGSKFCGMSELMCTLRVAGVH